MKDKVDYKALLLFRESAARRAAPTEPDAAISLTEHKARMARERWRRKYVQHKEAST